MNQAMNTRILLAASLLAVAAFGGGLMLAGPDARSQASDAKPEAIAAAPEAARDTTPDQPAETAAAASPAPDGPFVIKRILPISGPIRYGEWHWDETDVPNGPIVITVDLDARVLSIFRGGYEIGAAAVLLGTEDKPTPTGTFPITQKKRNHVSNLYGAPMPYMQRLTDDGITLHGSQVELGYASHGCIGMPESFAAKVFGQTRVGDKVIVTRGKTAAMGDALVDS